MHNDVINLKSDTCKFHMNNDIIMCQLDIVPIKNENGGVVFFLVSVKAGHQIETEKVCEG